MPVLSAVRKSRLTSSSFASWSRKSCFMIASPPETIGAANEVPPATP